MYFFPRLFASCLVFLILIVSPSHTSAQELADPGFELEKCWKYPVEDAGRSMIADDAVIYVGSINGRILAVNFNGEKAWSTELGGEVVSNLALFETGLFAVTSPANNTAEATGSLLRRISKDTGITGWTLRLADAEKFYIAVRGDVLFVISQKGAIVAIDPRSGHVIWRQDIAAEVTSEPVFAETNLIVPARGKKVHILLNKTGEVTTTRTTQYEITAITQSRTNDIIVGDDRGNVSILNGREKPLWKFKSGGQISGMITFDDHVIATSHDNFVYFLSLRNGDVEWKKRLAGRTTHFGSVGRKYISTMSLDEDIATISDIATGKTAGQLIFSADEKVIASPIQISGSFAMLTGSAIYKYSRNGGCKEIGQNK